MKNFEQIFGKEDILSKDQLLQITGGMYETCTFTDANGNSADIDVTSCTSDCQCQAVFDQLCESNDNCSNVDCGCK